MISTGDRRRLIVRVTPAQLEAYRAAARAAGRDSIEAWLVELADRAAPLLPWSAHELGVRAHRNAALSTLALIGERHAWSQATEAARDRGPLSVLGLSLARGAAMLCEVRGAARGELLAEVSVTAAARGGRVDDADR